MDKKEIVSFINLSGKETSIEIAFAVWLSRFSSYSISFLENNVKYSEIRNNEENDIYDFEIIQFNNLSEYPVILNTVNSDIIITCIDYKTDYISFLKYTTSLFIIIEKESQISLSSKITDTLQTVNKETKINYIFLTKSKILPKEFIFFNINRIQEKTYFFKNLNQIAFSKMLSKLNYQN